MIGSHDIFLSRGVALGTLVWQCGLNRLEQEGSGETSERETREEAAVTACPCNVNKF